MKLLIISLVLILSGCSYFSPNIKTIITLQDGDDVTVISKPDSLVTLKTKDQELLVDLRGRAGLIEQFFSAFLLKPNNRSSNTVGGN